MNEEHRMGQGRFLTQRERRFRPGRWVQVTMLLIWDGVLLYMIADCLIEPVWGAVFVGIISVYLGYRL